jgi:hypothetical protein
MHPEPAEADIALATEEFVGGIERAGVVIPDLPFSAGGALRGSDVIRGPSAAHSFHFRAFWCLFVDPRLFQKSAHYPLDNKVDK